MKKRAEDCIVFVIAKELSSLFPLLFRCSIIIRLAQNKLSENYNQKVLSHINHERS